MQASCPDGIGFQQSRHRLTWTPRFAFLEGVYVLTISTNHLDHRCSHPDSMQSRIAVRRPPNPGDVLQNSPKPDFISTPALCRLSFGRQPGQSIAVFQKRPSSRWHLIQPKSSPCDSLSSVLTERMCYD
jgi:hypothetical protein